MEETSLVQVRQRVAKLQEDRNGALTWQANGILENFLQVFPFAIIHDDVRTTVLLAEVVNLDYVRVVESAGCLRLALESLKAGVLSLHFLEENLDGNRLIHLPMPTLEDHAEDSPSNFGGNLIAV